MCSVVDGYRPAFRTLVTRAAPSTPNGSRKVEASASDQALAQAISNDLAIGLPLEDLADMSREEAFETYKESQVCCCSLSEGEVKFSHSLSALSLLTSSPFSLLPAHIA